MTHTCRHYFQWWKTFIRRFFRDRGRLRHDQLIDPIFLGNDESCGRLINKGWIAGKNRSMNIWLIGSISTSLTRDLFSNVDVYVDPTHVWFRWSTSLFSSSFYWHMVFENIRTGHPCSIFAAFFLSLSQPRFEWISCFVHRLPSSSFAA